MLNKAQKAERAARAAAKRATAMKAKRQCRSARRGRVPLCVGVAVTTHGYEQTLQLPILTTEMRTCIGKRGVVTAVDSRQQIVEVSYGHLKSHGWWWPMSACVAVVS